MRLQVKCQPSLVVSLEVTFGKDCQANLRQLKCVNIIELQVPTVACASEGIPGCAHSDHILHEILRECREMLQNGY